MTYEVKYRCRFYFSSDVIPQIDVRYRKLGARRWTKSKYDNRAIDRYLWDEHRTLYVQNTLQRMDMMGDDQRMMEFRRILDDIYGGSLNEYIKELVDREVRYNMAEAEDMSKALEIAISLVTDGWKTQTIEVE